MPTFPTGYDENSAPTTSDKILIADVSNSNKTEWMEIGNLPFPAIEAATFAYKTVVTVGSSHADYITDGTADDVQIEQAIADVSTAGGGIVYIKKGTYDITSEITAKNNVWVKGEGIDATILQGGIPSGYVFFNSTSQTITNFRVSDLTIDNESTALVGGIGLNKAISCNISQVKFKNNAKFMLVFGVSNAAGPIDCFNNTVENCIFDTHSGTNEMFLLMNSQGTRIIGNTFTGKTGGNPILGLYQLCEGTLVQGNRFIDNAGFSYYSLSCNNTNFDNNLFINSGGIKGANVSDNGAFGETSVRGLSFTNNKFIGGANSLNSEAIQIGATNGALLFNNTITKYNIGVLAHDGNTTANALATNFVIEANTFYNNTAANAAHSINTAIFFSSIGGSCYGTISNNKFFDTQGTPTQKYPIGFTGAFTWDYIDIVGNRMSAYDTGTSIVLTSSAALGSNVNISGNTAYSGSSPAQTDLQTEGNLINSATAKTTPVDADMVGLMDSAASNILKKLSWLNIKATLKTYFDTLYVALTGNQTIAGDKTFSGKIISSNATSLEIATGGGSTPSAINIGSGGAYIGQVNGNLGVRSGFGSKTFSFQDSSQNAKCTVALDNGKITLDATNTAGGTTGDRTINKPSGTVNIAAAGTTVTVTNSLVSTSSLIHAFLRTNDTTATIKNVVPGSGSFVINLGAAATAEVSIGFIVFN